MVRLFYSCCNDDTCAKTRDWVFSDESVLHHMASTVGQAIFDAQKDISKDNEKPNSAPNFGRNNAMLQGLIETTSNLVKKVTFNKLGQQALAKASPATGALLVTCMSFSLQFAVTNTVMSGFETMIQEMAKEGKTSANNETFEEIMARMERKGRSGEDTKMETTCAVAEALLGCSQVEQLRVYFAGDIPWKRNNPPLKLDNKTSNKEKLASTPEIPTQACWEII